jgi:hypothetical protein
METALPFSALLSQAYVAFAIEFDNQFEHQTPHRTTNYGSTPGFPHAPWLVSMAMWLRFMQHIPLEGIAAADFESRIAISNKGLQTWLTRLSKWWGYLTIDDPARKPGSARITPAAMVRPTLGGRKAIEVWQTLLPLMDTRWRERFGNRAIADLKEGLTNLAGQLDPASPACFAVLEYDDKKSRAARAKLPARELALPELLTKALIAFASEFDSKSAAPLIVCANLLRVTPDSGVRMRDLPRLTGLAAMGVDDGLRLLKYARLGAVRADPSGGRSRFLMIATHARLARDGYVGLAHGLENDWKKRYGADTVNRLRKSLEEIVESRDGGPSPLLRGLTPHPDCWRAQLPPLETLPHFPMESHRGGYADGS